MTIAPQGTMRILELITAQNGEKKHPVVKTINNKKTYSMMNKTIYIAPEVEQINVRFEENIMSVAENASAPKMNTQSAEAWGDWE